MREPDKNRVKRAVEHLNAAVTHLNSIKRENVSDMECSALDVAVWKITQISDRVETILKEEQQ